MGVVSALHFSLIGNICLITLLSDFFNPEKSDDQANPGRFGLLLGRLRRVYAYFLPFVTRIGSMRRNEETQTDFLFSSVTKPSPNAEISGVLQSEGRITFDYTPAFSYPAGGNAIVPLVSFKDDATNPWLRIEENAGTSFMTLDDGVNTASVPFTRTVGNTVAVIIDWNRAQERMGISVQGTKVTGTHDVDFPLDVLPGPVAELFLGEHQGFTSASGTFANIEVYDEEV